MRAWSRATRSLFLSNRHLVYNFRYTKAAPTAKTDDDLLKGVRKYTRTARKAWEAMSLPEDQGIDFEGEIEASR